MISVNRKGKEALMCINRCVCRSDTFCLVTVVPWNVQTLLHSIKKKHGGGWKKKKNSISVKIWITDGRGRLSFLL